MINQPLGVNEVESIVARLIAFYHRLDNRQLDQLSQIYHPQIVFIDPVAQHDGIDALQHYFSQLLLKTTTCRFEMTNQLIQGDAASLFWRMDFAHPSLKKGQLLTLEGTSLLRFAQDRVIYHRDYYDMGAMLYEHVPLLGHAVKAIKARLK